VEKSGKYMNFYWKIFAAALLTCFAAYFSYTKLIMADEIVISLDVCSGKAKTVTVITNSVEVEDAALLLEFYDDKNEQIYNLFGPLSLKRISEREFSFEVIDAVCSSTTSVVVSIDFELPLTMKFTENAKLNLLQLVTVEVAPSSIIVGKVQRLDF